MTPRAPLNVWLEGRHVATFTSKQGRDINCSYTEEAVDRWAGGIPLISCSLPLQTRPQDASVYASGLLPEGQHRASLAAALNVPANDTHALLQRFGRDVAGALIITSEGPEDRKGSVVPYSVAELEREVTELPERPLGIYEDSELSLAGLQDKLLLVQIEDGGWGRPVHGMPSTHILKLDDRLHPGLVAAETACLKLAAAIGLTTVDARLETIAGIPCLITSRFDRRNQGSTLVRIHQEDACQALGLDPEANNGRGKYQDAGGPSFLRIAGLLDKYARDPLLELDTLVAGLTYTVAIGNADAHGKNVALLHPEEGEISLAPLYDTVPTMLWPELRKNGAMSVHKRFPLADVTIDDIADEARTWRHDAERSREAATRTASLIRQSVEAIPECRPIAARIVKRVDRLLATA
jgi:serine/threonine-protein kinase HipA